ncbi:MAG TPA: ABC transporter substrate-binding protein [Acidimicrobiales bacterium]|nr:ABC transporter substrate-binding protein [Acidimicrobiales bacterium]
MKHVWRLGAALGLGCMVVSASLTVVGTQAASAAKSPIVIGYITSETGVASSTFADGPGGAQARIDAVNAKGGVNGHKLVLVSEDDQSSPAQDQTAAQDLVQNKGAFLVINYSPFAFASAKYLQQQGVPVVGSAFDGPEWATQPNTNMFSFAAPASSPINGKYYTYDYTGKFLHAIGVTKYAGLGYGISQSSQNSITAAFASAKPFGISQCYLNQSVPFGGVDFTADTLQMKSAGCNGVTGSFVDASDVALAGAVKHAGIKAKQLYFTGYDENILKNPSAAASFDGAYVSTTVNFTTPNAATSTMMSTLKKYDSGYSGGIPDFGLIGSYLSADLAIKGLSVAGKNPTRSSFITNLRKVGSYNAGGILPSPVTFQHFGTVGMFPKTACSYYAHLQNDKFTIYTGKAICGKRTSYPAT